MFETCPVCHGAKSVGREPCQECHGAGEYNPPCPACEVEMRVNLPYGLQCDECEITLTTEQVERIRATAAARTAEAVKPWQDVVKAADALAREVEECGDNTLDLLEDYLAARAMLDRPEASRG